MGGILDYGCSLLFFGCIILFPFIWSVLVIRTSEADGILRIMAFVKWILIAFAISAIVISLLHPTNEVASQDPGGLALWLFVFVTMALLFYLLFCAYLSILLNSILVRRFRSGKSLDNNECFARVEKHVKRVAWLHKLLFRMRSTELTSVLDALRPQGPPTD